MRVGDGTGVIVDVGRNVRVGVSVNVGCGVRVGVAVLVAVAVEVGVSVGRGVGGSPITENTPERLKSNPTNICTS